MMPARVASVPMPSFSFKVFLVSTSSINRWILAIAAMSVPSVFAGGFFYKCVEAGTEGHRSRKSGRYAFIRGSAVSSYFLIYRHMIPQAILIFAITT